MKKRAYSKCLERMRELRRAIREGEAKVKAAKSRIAELDRVASKYEMVEWSASEYGPYLRFYVTVNSFADPALVSALEDFGSMVPGKEFVTNDYPDINLREYRISDGDVSVEINARISDDSTSCRKVEVGSETVYKYKFVCDGEPA
jgi:hypothetical protein